MSLTLELSPELEAEARRVAAQAGMAPEDFAVAALQERVWQQRDTGPAPTDSSLLEQIGSGLTAEIWSRYHALTAKRRSQALTDSEYAELLQLSDKVEAWNVRRLDLLLQLAQLRGKPLRQLVEELGLAVPPYE
jgi:hypothetical protein